MMKLLLIDSQALFLEGLTNFLKANGIELLATAGSASEALTKIELFHPDFVLMDLEIADCNGFAAIRLIKDRFPEIAVVILTFHEEDEYLFEAIRAGAAGYLLKSMTPARLLEELRRMELGEPPFAPGLNERLLREFARLKTENNQNPAMNQEVPELTLRQKEVLRLLVEGYKYKEIAAILNIREITVKYHLSEILAKLHLANRTQLLTHARQIGFGS